MPRSTHVSAASAELIGPGKLKRINGRLAFSAPNLAPLYLDLASLRQVTCYGDVSLTADALELLVAHEVEVAWLTPGGYHFRSRLVGNRDGKSWVFTSRGRPYHFRSRLVGNRDSSALLRMAQYDCSRDERRQRELARSTVLAKIASQREAARHYQRHGAKAARDVLVKLDQTQRQAQHATSLDALRGYEGTASAAWFGLMAELFRPPWRFATRTHRPPRDPVNVLLSLGYTWLLNRAVSKLQARGFEVNVGFLHEYRAGRPSLGCDVMEPFRAPGVDRWVMAFCNHQQLDPHDFQPRPDGGYHLPAQGFGPTLTSWQGHWFEANLETALDRSIAEFERQIRQMAKLPTDSVP